MVDVFISYARSDQGAARRVAKALAAAGLEVWWDAELPAHRAYSEVIEDKLEEAKAVVVLWSAAAAKSQWVRAEADFARHGAKLAQAQLDATLPPMPFNQIQSANLNDWKRGSSHPGLSNLVASVKALVAAERAPVGTVPNPRWSTIRRWRWAAIAALVIVAATVAFLMSTKQSQERRPVVAVLPFRSLDSNDEALAAGMWEDTRQAIGHNPHLVVLGPNTAQQLAEKGPQASRKAADYIVEASIRTAGDRIRISTDLIRTKDGQQLWSQDFDRKLDDVFALQSDVASEIEGRIRGRLAEQGGAVPEHIATTGEVYALYSDARAKIRKRGGASGIEAYAELRRVVALDPNFAPGWATLSELQQLVPGLEKDAPAAHSAERNARKALELAPNLAAAHAALAFALHLSGPAAQAEIQRAVQLDPNDYEAANWLGNMRFDSGDVRGAVAAYWQAVDIEPLFYPAVLNLARSLEDARDKVGIERLVANERNAGASYLAAAVEMETAWRGGDLARAANLGLADWGNAEIRPLISEDLWALLLELGFVDEAFSLVPAAADFAPYIWRNDPKGLKLYEAHNIDARTFFGLDPATQNVARVYLLTGRGTNLANLYLSLKTSPEEFVAITGGRGRFLEIAPLVAVALSQTHHGEEAAALLGVAEDIGKELSKGGTPESSALLAEIYAAGGRKDDALRLLGNAVARRWIPAGPDLQPDLHFNPAFASLKGDPTFEKLRNDILGTVSRERAQVNVNLLRQLSGSPTKLP